MIRESAGAVWPVSTPPAASEGLSWRLTDVAELPGVRAALRVHVAGARVQDLRDRLVLALDEMASNALRHGGGDVRAAVRRAGNEYLLEVSDRAPERPPAPAVDRDPSEGGLGLHMIAELAIEHGWYVQDGAKHVWAVLAP